MGYGPGTCLDRFSTEQVARMRCFVDRYCCPAPFFDDVIRISFSLSQTIYRYVGDSRRVNQRDVFPPVLVAPTFRNADDGFVTVEWYPPLNLLVCT